MTDQQVVDLAVEYLESGEFPDPEGLTSLDVPTFGPHP